MSKITQIQALRWRRPSFQAIKLTASPINLTYYNIWSTIHGKRKRPADSPLSWEEIKQLSNQGLTSTIKINKKKLPITFNESLPSPNKVIVVRIGEQNGPQWIKFYQRTSENSKIHETPIPIVNAELVDTTLKVNLAECESQIAEKIIHKFLTAHEAMHGISHILFDLGNTNLETLLPFAVRTKESDKIRVIHDGEKELLCIYNKYYLKKELTEEEKKIAAKYEESLGQNIQRALYPGAAHQALDIRIYTGISEIINGLDYLLQLFYLQIERARRNLSYLLPVSQGEIIRVILSAEEGTHKAYYLEDILREGNGAKRAALLFNVASITFSPEINKMGGLLEPDYHVTLSREALDSELRHAISMPNINNKNVGYGLLSAHQELFDRLKQINTLSPKALSPHVLLLEWYIPFDNGHKIIDPAISKTIQMFMSLSREYPNVAQETLFQVINQYFFKHYQALSLRPANALLDLGIALAINSIKCREKCSKLKKAYLKKAQELFEIINKILRTPTYAFQILDDNNLMVNKYKKILDMLNASQGDEETKNQTDAILKHEFYHQEERENQFIQSIAMALTLSVEDIESLKIIAIKYYQLCELLYLKNMALSQKKPQALTSARKKAAGFDDSINQIGAELQKLLVNSPLAYIAPDGTRYPTQLAYIFGNEQIEELARKAIEELIK